MDKLLTISIAAYNVENYIRKTLDSLILTKGMEKLEVFVVDDGGNDGTLEIAKEYQERYPDTFIPVHKENGGYGTTVNYSVQHATGKYFKLLDGDDWFDTLELSILLEILEKTDVDAVCTHYSRGQDDEHMELVRTHHQKEGTVIDLREGFPERRSFEMWELVLKTDVIRKSGMVLPERELYTDRYYTMFPFAYVDTLLFSNISVYRYRIERDGQSMSIESQLKHRDDRINGSFKMCEFYAEQKKAGNPRCDYLLKNAAARHTAAASLVRFLPKTKENLSELKQYEKDIKKISKDIIDQEWNVGKFGKLLTVCRHTNYLPYWLMPWKYFKGNVF